MNEQTLSLDWGTPLTLRRWPLSQQDPLRAWDTADQYLLNHCHSEGLLDTKPRILIVNDGFGALGTALADLNPVHWNDSELSRLSWQYNMEANQHRCQAEDWVPSTELPQGKFDLVILKADKSLVFWESTLLRLRPFLKADSIILTGSMIKHTPKRIYELLESCIGETRTTLGWKKARLAVSRLNPDAVLPHDVPQAEWQLHDFKLDLADSANVFSRGKLDAGTRLLLENLPETQRNLRIMDLGCGNGVLALAAARKCPQAQISGVDESYMAVSAAKGNAENNGLDQCVFNVADGLRDAEPQSLDMILCNPPFHQTQTVGDQIAWTLFQQSKRALVTGGELRVVGNRHLGYHVKLKRLFGRCDVLAANAKFVVLSAKKTSGS